MPTYGYVCTNCGIDFEIYQSIHADSLTDCITCETKNVLVRKIYAPLCLIKGSPTTLGQLAERNTEKLGKDEAQERQLKRGASKENIKKAKAQLLPKTPWWRDGTIPGLKKKKSPLTMKECEDYLNDGTVRVNEPKTNPRKPKRKT
jgi:putative FmdB family regulatory protein